MHLEDLPLKIIREFNLMETEELKQLRVDTKGWTQKATEKSEDKISQIYAKIHKGVLLRLLLPFAYFMIVKWVKDLMTAPEEEQDLFSR